MDATLEKFSRDDISRYLSSRGIPPADKIISYVELILTKNDEVNLTGAKNYKEFIDKHVLDVWLAVQKYQPQEYIADIGSGGGIPGILLAIFHPTVKVTLVERTQKKAKCLEYFISSLKLEGNVRVINKTFEEVDCYKYDELWFRGFLPGIKLAPLISGVDSKAELPLLVLMKCPAWSEEKIAIMNTKFVKSSWVERFAESSEVTYELPDNLGSRRLVLV